ncbi:AIPR family protein [Neobacillus mesonae]|uniref:AIPR family protein n=1 Tax=Neobacillus mesonae TaxID=1193713 RepID=UPI001372427A|nr:AIPR family protein [Neobacillus mesonae]
MSKVKKFQCDKVLANQVEESINEYLNENGYRDSVGKGNGFCEWILYNIFELTEDKVIEATEISGKFDNGIDAVFENHGELHILQSKYLTSHSIDSVQRFIADCQRVCTEKPTSDRDAVKELCLKVMNAYNDNEPINCYYITNSEIDEWHDTQINASLMNKRDDFQNLKYEFYDFYNIVENIELKKGLLPKEFRDKKIELRIEENFSTFETYVAKVRTSDFAHFVNEGGNLLFHSNIRNYLNSTQINSGMKKTLKEEPEKFWFFNNGVTIVCDKFNERMGSLELTAPQIVNGCQTAKTIGDFYKYKSKKELAALHSEGHLLVKIIKTQKSTDESKKKQLRDNITRFTNSQNAVRGLDFYALDEFQQMLTGKFEKLGYYYEIQRGSFIALNSVKQNSYKGNKDYEYLISGIKSKKKYVLPAKEVIQSFTAGIKLMPDIAYGRANELTPTGNKWKDIMNDETKGLPLELFLFPYLTLKYIKEELGYKTGASDFKVNSAFLFIATYYLLLTNLVNTILGTQYESADNIDIEIIKDIYKKEALNKKLFIITHGILKMFFQDSIVEDAKRDNLRGFIQNKMKQGKNFWSILERKIELEINELPISSKEVYEELKVIIQFNSKK